MPTLAVSLRAPVSSVSDSQRRDAVGLLESKSKRSWDRRRRPRASWELSPREPDRFLYTHRNSLSPPAKPPFRAAFVYNVMVPMPRRKITTLDDAPIHLTADGIRRLEEKLARLKAALPERIGETARTAAFGDRSDNAEYAQAKGTLRRTHAQIFVIEDQLRRAVKISTGKNASGTVRLGSTVVLESRDGSRSTYQILGSHETKPERGRISNQSPLGAALMHHMAGDVITITTPGGTHTHRILKVS